MSKITTCITTKRSEILPYYVQVLGSKSIFLNNPSGRYFIDLNIDCESLRKYYTL